MTQPVLFFTAAASALWYWRQQHEGWLAGELDRVGAMLTQTVSDKGELAAGWRWRVATCLPPTTSSICFRSAVTPAHPLLSMFLVKYHEPVRM
ncbi:hypothetical protein E2C01_001542 [Portunus trituberculatus]|uniref:Uncharacterized protein n=1 Tax=Portunus trituberculatus TaxID=210409 RepID=A0A5B7CI31_PORTR|nr:hypothetical protein [Portunus trituberculatus]